MLEYSDEDGSDYEGVDEDFDEDSNTDSDYGYFDEDRDSDGDVPLDVLRTRLEDSNVIVRGQAFRGLSELEPATLAQLADVIAAKLKDSDWGVRQVALYFLSRLELETLAQHAGAVAARLEDSTWLVRMEALKTLGKLEPLTFARHAHAVVKTLNENDRLKPVYVEELRLTTLPALPLVVTRDINFKSHNLRERLLGRIAWYRCRLRLRVRRIALYWYALPYRPSGPGHARDVEAWGQMNVE